MAQYIKFRLNAAKVGVSMALLAAIGGVTERAEASSRRATATPDFLGFLKLTGLSKAVSTPFIKIEKKLIKMNREIQALEKKDKQFLKIKTANSEFASVKLLNSEVLKIDDAIAKLLPVGGTAANAAKLDGLTPDAFVQGHGGVVSAGILIGLNQPSATPLLQTPDGMLGVAISSNPNAVTLTFTNNTGGTLDGVATDSSLSGGQRTKLAPGQTPVRLPGGDVPHQYHLQLFPNAQSKEALTLMLSTEPSSSNAEQLEVVGQLLIGLL